MIVRMDLVFNLSTKEERKNTSIVKNLKKIEIECIEKIWRMVQMKTK